MSLAPWQRQRFVCVGWPSPETSPALIVDAQQPLAPSGGLPLAAGRFTVERDVVVLSREARALAAFLKIGDRDVRTLTGGLHDCARRLREAGAQGIAELGIANGPRLQVVFRALGSPELIESLPRTLEPLRGIVRDLLITIASDTATIVASIPVPSDSEIEAPLSIPDTLMAGAQDDSGPLGVLLRSPPAGGPATEGSDPEFTHVLQAELSDVVRDLASTMAEFAECRERLDAAVVQATTLQKHLDGRAGDVAAANRAIEDFLSMLSHELRTPLNAILGWTSLLRMGHLDVDGTSRALDALERNACAQAQLIGDILDASRIVTGQLQLDIRPVGFAALIDMAVDAVQPEADAKGIALEKTILFDGQLSGDSERLRQVVLNLLSNAIKFTPEGGRVRVTLAPAGQNVTLTISDSGQGIDQAFLPFVFERFRQGDASATRSHGGLGLGLSIARYIVELHGGCIQVASDGPGRGSSFTVQLPASAA